MAKMLQIYKIKDQSITNKKNKGPKCTKKLDKGSNL
jgi:ribosomal protein S27AE